MADGSVGDGVAGDGIEGDGLQSDSGDDFLRTQFHQSFPGSSKAGDVLADLVPAMGRARRWHRVRLAASSAAVALVVGGAAMAALPQADETSGLVVAGPGPGEGLDPETSLTTTAPVKPDESTDGTGVGSPTSSVLEGQSANADEADSPTSTSESGSGTSLSTSTSGPLATAAPTTSLATTTSEPSTTTLSTTTGSETTTTTTVDNETITSDCGSIVVRVSGSSVFLESTSPAAGYEASTSNSGPEKVEVSFEKESGHCEIEASVSDGELLTSIENES